MAFWHARRSGLSTPLWCLGLQSLLQNVSRFRRLQESLEAAGHMPLHSSVDDGRSVCDRRNRMHQQGCVQGASTQSSQISAAHADCRDGTASATRLARDQPDVLPHRLRQPQFVSLQSALFARRPQLPQAVPLHDAAPVWVRAGPPAHQTATGRPHMLRRKKRAVAFRRLPLRGQPPPDSLTRSSQQHSSAGNALETVQWRLDLLSRRTDRPAAPPSPQHPQHRSKSAPS